MYYFNYIFSECNIFLKTKKQKNNSTKFSKYLNRIELKDSAYIHVLL